jgi:hypothetical protein
MTKPPFDYRELKDGEKYPHHYIFWDGLQWTRGSNSAGYMYDKTPDFVVMVPMTAAEVANIDMTIDLWLTLTPEERLRYNTPAILAYARGKKVERLAYVWEAVWDEPCMQWPFRVAQLTTEPVWYMVQYPDGTGMTYQREDDAIHSSGGNPVICVKEVK